MCNKQLKRPTISIITPCRNATETIVDTVLSVLSQDFKNWELILVSDDGRSYIQYLNSLGINDKRIREHSKKTFGEGHTLARDRGLTIAEGRFLADLDADDVWRPSRLSRLIPLAEKYGAVQDVLECFDDSGFVRNSGQVSGKIKHLTPRDVVAFDVPFHLVVRRDICIGHWACFPIYAPDPIRTAIVADKVGLIWLQEPLLRYRVSRTSMSQSINGGLLINESYEEALAVLDEDDGYGLRRGSRRDVKGGILRKKRLNWMHYKCSKADPSTLPFIPWVLLGNGGEDRGGMLPI